MTLKLIIFHFCDDHGPTAIWCTKYQDSSQPIAPEIFVQDPIAGVCPSCYHFSPTTPYLVTKAENSTFVSCAKHGIERSDEDTKALQHLAVRLFSSEVMDLDDSILFLDDAIGGLAIGTTYRVPDNSARGFFRKYAAALLIEVLDSSVKSFMIKNKAWLVNSMLGIGSSVTPVTREENDENLNIINQVVEVHSDPADDSSDNKSINLHRMISKFFIKLDEKGLSHVFAWRQREVRHTKTGISLLRKLQQNSMHFACVVQKLVLCENLIFISVDKEFLEDCVKQLLIFTPFFDEVFEPKKTDNFWAFALRNNDDDSQTISVDPKDCSLELSCSTCPMKTQITNSLIRILENASVPESACQSYIECLRNKYISLAKTNVKELDKLLATCNISKGDSEVVNQWSIAIAKKETS